MTDTRTIEANKAWHEGEAAGIAAFRVAESLSACLKRSTNPYADDARLAWAWEDGFGFGWETVMDDSTRDGDDGLPPNSRETHNDGTWDYDALPYYRGLLQW